MCSSISVTGQFTQKWKIPGLFCWRRCIFNTKTQVSELNRAWVRHECHLHALVFISPVYNIWTSHCAAPDIHMFNICWSKTQGPAAQTSAIGYCWILVFVAFINTTGSKCFYFLLLTSGKRTLPEASSSSSLMAWWWHLCQRRFSATRSCQTLCLTQNTSQVWFFSSSYALLPPSWATLLYHLPVRHSLLQIASSPRQLAQAHWGLWACDHPPKLLSYLFTCGHVCFHKQLILFGYN